jgi:hypothetical protein
LLNWVARNTNTKSINTTKSDIQLQRSTKKMTNYNTVS